MIRPPPICMVGSTLMAEKRLIDQLRDSGKSMDIGTDGDDSAITDVISIDRTMYLVKERGLYTVRLADEIDPERTNLGIPDIQQRVLSVGSINPMVARTLLTADTLFDQK